MRFSQWAMAGDTSQKTALRSHRHHQHHRSGVPGQSERHETLDPVRSDAMDSRFHCVEQAPASVRLRSDRHDQHEIAENLVSEGTRSSAQAISSTLFRGLFMIAKGLAD
jgi:hypothetical protein